MDRHSVCRLGQIPVIVHRMAGEIQTGGGLLHVHLFHGGILRNIRQLDLMELG